MSPVALSFSLLFVRFPLIAESIRNGSIFTIWKFSATRSTNVRARAHNSLRIHLNLHNNPKCSAMSFCRFNYYCLNNFALLAGARATVCCYYYHLSLFSLQIVGRLCVSVYLWYTDNVTTHMNGKQRLMATKLNQMPLFFSTLSLCVWLTNFVCMNRKKNMKR